MAAIKIPSGSPFLAPQPYDRQQLAATIRQLLAGEVPFTGYLAITSDQAQHLLFFFQGAPYAAGVSVGARPSPLPLLDFLNAAGKLDDPGAILSVQQTDPVLLKCLLVFIQDELTAKAPTTLINLESILAQIRQEAADALIILEKQGMYNLFFFKDGNKGKAYYADGGYQVEEGLAIDEQLLLYAFQGGDVPINALIYRTIATTPAADAGQVTPEVIERILGGAGDQTGIFIRPETPGIMADETFEAEVLAGTLRGTLLAGRLPCLLGRRDADLVIPDPMVSKSHCLLQIRQGGLLLTDQGSTNGTYLNGQRVQQHQLMAGDIISIGGTQLKLIRWGTTTPA